MSELTTEQIWQDFWKDIVTDANGDLDIEQVKKELADYRTYMQETTLVYDYITRGRISKVNTKSDAVIGEAEDTIQEAIKDACQEENEKLREALDKIANPNFGISIGCDASAEMRSIASVALSTNTSQE